jgi:hypothetical protein
MLASQHIANVCDDAMLSKLVFECTPDPPQLRVRLNNVHDGIGCRCTRYKVCISEFNKPRYEGHRVKYPHESEYFVVVSLRGRRFDTVFVCSLVGKCLITSRLRRLNIIPELVV